MKELKELNKMKELSNLNALRTEKTDFISGIEDLGTLSVKSFTGYKLSELTREDFKDNKFILDKYFRNQDVSNKVKLDRFHIPQITPAEYEAIIPELISSKVSKENLKYATASDYYKRKAMIHQVAKDLGVRDSMINTKDYIWDARYYLYTSFLENIFRVDDMYRDLKDDEDTSAKSAYIDGDPHKAVIDMDMFNGLYRFCIKAIQKRKVMLLMKVESCLGFLTNVIEYTYGFTQNPTPAQVATVKKYNNYFKEYLGNKEFAEWLSKNNDVKVFAKDINTRADYIDTYRGILVRLASSDENLEWFRDFIAFEDDDCIDEILEDRHTQQVALYNA